jgi:hypothetical protein
MFYNVTKVSMCFFYKWFYLVYLLILKGFWWQNKKYLFLQSTIELWTINVCSMKKTSRGTGLGEVIVYIRLCSESESWTREDGSVEEIQTGITTLWKPIYKSKLQYLKSLNWKTMLRINASVLECSCCK